MRRSTPTVRPALRVDLGEVTRTSPLPALVRRRSHFFRGLLDEFGHGCGLRYVDRVAARDLDNGRARPSRHLALGRWRDHPVFRRDELPAWLAPPRRLADLAAQGLNTPRDLRVGHERSLLGAQVTREGRVELLPVEEQKPVLRGQNRRQGRAGRRISDQRVYRLAFVRSEGRDVDERCNLGMVSRLGDDRPAVRAMMLSFQIERPPRCYSAPAIPSSLDAGAHHNVRQALRPASCL
jgi:hypothetical protein